MGQVKTMTRGKWNRWTAMVAAMSLPLVVSAGCASDGEGDYDIPSFENYVGGKSDTGYVGTRAAELESVFTGKVRVIVDGKTRDELTAIATALKANPSAWEHREITGQVTEQIKYARNALKKQKLDLNLEGGAPLFSDVVVIDAGLELTYTVKVESLIKFKELETSGMRAEDFVGRTVEPTLPLVPKGLFERVGASCATDPDTGAAVPSADLGAHNMFYYWDPTREGCPLSESFLHKGKMVVQSSLDAPIVYPEYDKLVADGKIDMVVIFGQITHGELASNDWGFISFRTMTRSFERMGFRKVATHANNAGHKLSKTYPSGLVATIDMYTPVGFADNVPREEANTRFRDAIRNNEIVYYNGHAFYGSLTVLDDKTIYPVDRYQIIFMDACWSYAYYTKQIFRNRATDADPTGYGLVDVVNNTEPGITGSEETAAILYDNLFKGAALVKARGNAADYSWNNMIKYMNDHAEARARARAGSEHPNPEIYGVSGVRSNKWTPAGVRPDEPPPPAGATRHENSTVVAIPDDNATGASKEITVPASAKKAAEVKIEVNVEHTYVGDLTVTLSHGGKSVVLHDKAGGSQDNLSLRMSSTAFSSLTIQGRWTLKVVDSEGQDVGAIKTFALEL